MHGKALSEKTKNLMLRVEKLPKIDSFGKLQEEFDYCKRVSEEVKHECSEIN